MRPQDLIQGSKHKKKKFKHRKVLINLNAFVRNFAPLTLAFICQTPERNSKHQMVSHIQDEIIFHN